METLKPRALVRMAVQTKVAVAREQDLRSVDFSILQDAVDY